MGSLAEAVKAVAGFTRVSGVPDYRKDWDRNSIYEVLCLQYVHTLLEEALVLPTNLIVVTLVRAREKGRAHISPEYTHFGQAYKCWH